MTYGFGNACFSRLNDSEAVTVTLSCYPQLYHSRPLMSLAETLATVQVLSLEQCRLYHTSLPFFCTLTHPSAFCELWEVPSTLFISFCKSSTCIFTLAGHEEKVCVFIFRGNSMTDSDSPLQCVGIEEIIQRER